MTATELTAILAEADVVPSKRLGQNFLVDENTAKWIVDQLNLESGDTVVEVGPGTGALTEHLIGRVAKIILVEYDRRLAEYLTKRFADCPEVTVINHDAVRLDIRPFFAHKRVKLLGNLPYSAGGAILRNFLKGPSPFVRAVLMLQKEMIDRILAGPRCKDFGVLTLRMQCEWQGESVKVVPPSCFIPRPLIDSTVMTLEPRQAELPVHDRRLFDELVRRGFAQRRKQLRKNLPSDIDWDAVSEKLGLLPTARAEELSLDDWVSLTREVDPLFEKEEGQGDGEMLTVVDENDQVIGSERRDVIHRDGLTHRAVHIFALNQKGEIFLQKRSRLKDKCPGLWDSSAAGHVDAGEEYEACAVRELEEELGLADHEMREVGKLGAHANTGWEHVRLYATLAQGKVRFPCVEIEYGEWFTMAQIEDWVNEVPEDFAPVSSLAGSSGKKRIRDALSEEIKILPGQSWGIVGRNGSGKSTLAASLAEKFQGSLVSFEEEDRLLERELREDDSEFINRIDYGRTVRELMEEVRPPEGDLVSLATDLGLARLLDQGFLSLSTGERRRLMLARALIQEPELLVLDEPFDGLDQAFRAPLKKLLEGRDLIIVANRLSDLEGLVSHLACVEAGDCILAGAHEKVIENESLQQLMNLDHESIVLPERREISLPDGPLVVMKDVTVVHGGREIISSFDWIVERGENWKISGPNGCGKSTLVNLVTGDHPQCYSNDVTVMGVRRGSGETVWDIKSFIGIVSPTLHQQYRVGANALTVVASGFFDSVGIYQQVSSEQLEVARTWLGLVGMSDCEKSLFRGLSYGQQRLLLIARALVKQPPLLIFDEPCQGLDPMNRALVLSVIDRIAATGRTQILYITHEPEDRLECVTHELRHDGKKWLRL